MIDMDLYNEMLKKWYKVGDVYQEPRRVLYRLEHFEKYCLPFLQDKDVLEVGCNAGIFGFHIAQVARAYLGLEPANKVRDKSKKRPPKTDYFKQALITKEYIENKNAAFLNQTITELCDGPIEVPKINAFVACYALYHFRDKELDLLKKHIFPNCEVIIIQNRNQKRPTEHNSYKFWKDKNVVAFFEEMKFSCEVIPAVAKKGTLFSEIICRKVANENRGESISDRASKGEAPEGRDTRSGEGRVHKGSTLPDVQQPDSAEGS